VPKLGKGLRALKYPEWVATLTNLEKANGIPSREATQFWKEGLDNKAAGEAHECKSPAEVKEVAKKLYWTEANLPDLEEFRERQSSKPRNVIFLP
jgi:hypothetical protein